VWAPRGAGQPANDGWAVCEETADTFAQLDMCIRDMYMDGPEIDVPLPMDGDNCRAIIQWDTFIMAPKVGCIGFYIQECVLPAMPTDCAALEAHLTRYDELVQHLAQEPLSASSLYLCKTYPVAAIIIKKEHAVMSDHHSKVIGAIHSNFNIQIAAGLQACDSLNLQKKVIREPSVLLFMLFL
jgi:hypothetical protein